MDTEFEFEVAESKMIGDTVNGVIVPDVPDVIGVCPGLTVCSIFESFACRLQGEGGHIPKARTALTSSAVNVLSCDSSCSATMGLRDI